MSDDTPPRESRRWVGLNDLTTIGKLHAYRPIRAAQVSKLKRAMLAGAMLVGIVIVADVGTGGRPKWLLIDGNHRIAAIKELIEEDPTRKFLVLFQIWDHPSQKKILQIFHDANAGVRVTPLDYLLVGLGFGKYPIVEKVLDESFPVPMSTASGGIKEGFRIYTFLKAHLQRNGLSLGVKDADSVLRRLERLTEKDYEQMRSFADAFHAAFGMPGAGNPFSSFHLLNALMKVYATNADHPEKGGLTHDETVDRWHEKVLTNDNVLRNAKMTGYEATKHLALFIVDAMNEGRVRRKALSPYPNVEVGGENDGRGEGPGVATA